MDKVDVVEGMIASYLGTFLMLGFLFLWDFFFGLRMSEVSFIMSLVMGLTSSICGIATGFCLAAMLRRF